MTSQQLLQPQGSSKAALKSGVYMSSRKLHIKIGGLPNSGILRYSLLLQHTDPRELALGIYF